MRFILLMLFSSIQIFALNIFLNSASERGVPYSILHIVDGQPFSCKSVPLSLDKKSYICMIDKTINTKIDSKKLKLVNIDFLKKEDKLYIRIDPKTKSNIISLEKPLYNTQNIDSLKKNEKSKHWIILLYQIPPFGTTQNSDGINFPITYTKHLMPSIGSVDLNGAPISYAASKDIYHYLEIQKEYNKGDYKSAISGVNNTLEKYPNSIFKSDLLLYKLGAMDNLLDNKSDEEFSNQEISSLAKSWIRNFSSNENIPKVLYYLVKSYLRSGSAGDVNYFLDILITEHKDSFYTKKAILHFADSLYKKDKKNKAIKLYKDVLYSTKNLDIASLAAIRLTSTNIDSGKLKSAKDYLNKVLDVNRDFLLKDKLATQALAEKLAANKLPKMAVKVSDFLLANLGDDVDKQRESLLRDSGNWHAKIGDTKEAYQRYREYKKRYKEGEYIDDVNLALDELFFKTDESNSTKLLNYYNKLISKYNNYIKDKAVIAKAKLLMKQKKYNEVLSMKNLLDNTIDSNETLTNDIIKDAAKALVEEDIESKNCYNAVLVLENFKLNQNLVNDKEKLFSCFMNTKRYAKAEKLAKIEQKSSDLKQKFKWLQNFINSEYKLQKFDKSISVSRDVFSLAKVLSEKVSQDTYLSLFGSYYNLEQYGKSLEILEKLDSEWSDSVKNIAPYYKISLYANNKRDDLLLIKYSKKIVKLQDKNRLFLYSPNVEFLLIDALKRVSKIKDAMVVAKRLNETKLNDSVKSRVLYQLGELSIKLKDSKNAKKYLNTCSSIKTDNSWKSLCVESLKLL